MKKITKMILASCIILGLLFTTKPLYAENVETQDEYQMLMYDYQQEAVKNVTVSNTEIKERPASLKINDMPSTAIIIGEDEQQRVTKQYPYSAVMFLKGYFQISEEIINIVNKIFKISIIIVVAKGFEQAITVQSKIIKKIQSKISHDKTADNNSLGLIIKIAKAIIYTIAAVLIIQELGYDLKGLIAGLGIGGVIITLAAQDTAKNLFGGLVIFLDKPFKVGDIVSINEKGLERLKNIKNEAKVGPFEIIESINCFNDYKIRSLNNQLSDMSSDFNKEFDSFGSIPFYMIGGFIIVASSMIAFSIFMFTKRREIMAFTAQQVMPVAQEGIEKMTPTVGNAVGTIGKELAKGIKEGINESNKENDN